MKRALSNQDTKNTRTKPDTSKKGLYLSFPIYFLLWLERYGEENEKYNAVDQIVVHELRLPLQGSRNVEGKGNIRRFVWIEEKDENGSILTFGAMFDEFEPEKKAYVAFLEGSTYGTSMVKPILRSYAEFISLITKDWILHIWADAPPPDETYLFRNALHSQEETGENSNRNQELREMYAAFLKQSGFSGDKYEYQFDLPPLPQFGKKIEENTIKQFNELQKNISEELQKLNEMFVNTHCVQLNSRIKPLPTFTPIPFNRSHSEGVVNDKDFCEDLSLDFSNRMSAIKSSKKLIEKLCVYGKSVGIYFPYDIHRLRENSQLEKYVKRALRSIYEENTE
ncbi:hypothetical protein HDV01_004800 [Terramyces sp. JEL0728]|nr:hypothetical protein HDV01_004800 [Terramyces sp. JEL0728]